MGENLIIQKKNGNRVPLENRRTATRVTSGKQTWALNADDKLNFTIESPFPQTYEIGDRITVFGRLYTLNRLPKVKRTGMHEFSYDVEFEGVQYDLLRVTYDLTIDTTNNKLQDVQGDSLTGDLRRFMSVLIANANRVFPGKWKMGTCPETIGDKTLTFGESDNCLAVLQSLCNNFNVEFEIVNSGDDHTINLKESVGQTLPYTFQYGKGRGLYALNRDNVSSANIITRLKVYGSTENITQKYRADRLCMPGKSKAQSYIEKPEAVAKYGIFEGRKNFDVKPTFTGKVGAIVQGNVLQFQDNTFPFDLNAKEPDGVTTKYLINGVDAKIHFNTGNLAGYEFTVRKYDHATHTFTINKFTDDRGDVFPSETSPAFQFTVGNEYKILDIAYSRDIEEAAEMELAEKGNVYYDQNCQPKVQYGLTVTKEWLQKLVNADASKIVNVFAPGDYLRVVDNEIDVNKAIRIKSFVRNVLDPYDYTLTISDITSDTNITTRVISELIDIDKALTINNLKDPARAMANWRSSREVLDMVFDPEGDYYTDKIKPNSIDTLALSVGAKSMQFSLTNTVFQPNFNGDKNVLKWQGGVLTHYTINEEHAASWILADGQATLSADSDAFYIYAKCSKADDSGTIVLEKTQHKVDSDANYYYFWIGVLNSVDKELNARSIALTYGFTMVNGRFIKTGRIESADGTTYFDLDNSEIGGRIVFNSNGQEKTLEELGKEALVANEAASHAQDTANGKRRVFVATPKPPYDVGDLWVDGKDLRRCNTAKASGQAYNVNDWVVAVYYDNTKTTIDGGIVTSGTIQVAGSNASILAGITGQGTAANSIRFWAGASFENRATAPYRVMQDGSVVMTKATVDGVINAISGKIGGFDIAPGRIGVDDQSGTYNHDGLALLDNLVKFSKNNSNESIYSAIGTNVLPLTTGIPCLGKFSYQDGYKIGKSAIALLVRCRPNLMHPWYIQRAFDFDGNLFGVGCRSFFRDGYIGKAYTDVITSYIGVTHDYYFTECEAKLLSMQLPSKNEINSIPEVKNNPVFFILNIFCDPQMNNTIRLLSKDGAQMYNYKGQYQEQLDMNNSDCLTMVFHNGKYIWMNWNW